MRHTRTVQPFAFKITDIITNTNTRRGAAKRALWKRITSHGPRYGRLDLAMPVINGLEAAHTLSKIVPAVQLIMLTNHVNQLIEPEARATGISVFLSKDEGMDRLAELCVA